MRTGSNRNRNIDRAIVFARHSLTQPHASVVDKFHSLAVNKEFNLLAGNIAADAEVLDRKLVLAIGWEVVVNQDAATRAKWKTLDVVTLSDIARFEITRLRRCLPIPNRHTGNPRRRGRIGFQQCWRYR